VRSHDDVVRGPSVRGAIAFSQVVYALAGLNGSPERECILKAALITLTPRISVRATVDAATVVSDVVNEVLYGIRSSDKPDEFDRRESAGLRLDDNMASLAEIRELGTRRDLDAVKTKSFAVVSERPKREKFRGRWEDLDLSEDARGYFSVKKAVMSLISDLEAKLRAGKIALDEFERHKSGLMAKLRDSASLAMRMSGGELANTIIEMMDAQDKQWNSEVSFSRMQVYYHIKGTCEGANLSPLKQDYHALKWLIDDLQTQNILRPTDDAAGFLLTAVALDVLLKYLTDNQAAKHGGKITPGLDGAPTSYRSHEVRRYSRGDRFRDLSVRHTLKEIARRKRTLLEVRETDLRVFKKEPLEPHSDIVLCIDTSGSMGFHQKLTYARLAAAGLVKAACEDGNRAGIVAFGDRGQTIVSLTRKNDGLLLNRIAGLYANGNTNIGDGIKSARELLFRSSSPNRKHVILITDGQASAVSEAAFTRLSSAKTGDLTEESALWETSKAVAEGVQVSVVYVAPLDEEVDLFIRNIVEIGRGKICRMGGLADLKNMLWQ